MNIPPQYWSKLLEHPNKKPVLWFRMGGKAIFSDHFSEVPSAQFLDKMWHPEDAAPTPFKKGYFGVIPYDIKRHENIPEQIRVFRVHDLTIETLPEWSPQTETWSLQQEDSDTNYLQNVRRVLEDIKQGRYYQINILRFFKCLSKISQNMIIKKLAQQGGPWSAWFRHGNLEIASFSPERFLNITPEGDQYKLTTWPIKGTVARSEDPAEDQKQKELLAQSRKEQSELHMIVDLMRNDMNKICQPHSVKVLSPGKISSFSDIHHNIAEITADLGPFCFQDLFTSMCPGGSITGTPKHEVMKAISEYETQKRGLFMGHVFYWDDAHIFESNILIRTLIKNKHEWNYAAGGGLTLRSNPNDELAEIELKCASVMNGKN